MRSLTRAQAELIEAVIAEIAAPGITLGLLEKDFHVTEALRAILALEPEGLQLVFCGGTSLSKAHGLIERMSEDIDIKLVPDGAFMERSRAEQRGLLGDLRESVAAALGDLGFVQDEERRQSLNNRRFMCSHWSFERQYADAATVLRPQLQVELTVRSPVLPVETRVVNTLAHLLAKQSGRPFEVRVVSIAETEAEKVLSFLRRFAQHRSGQMKQGWDVALVRHIYDVHCIHVARPDLLDSAASAFSSLVEGDVREFGSQFPDFERDARAVLAQALQQSGGDEQTRREYDDYLLPLVYGSHRPGFNEAFATFDHVARRFMQIVS